MAAPTAPTLTTLVTEGLKKAGYPSPTTQPGLTRAQDEFMEEIKNDIWMLGKRLKSLQTSNIVILAEGTSIYSFPTNYSSPLSARLLDSDDYDRDDPKVAQASAASTITLDADEDITEEDILGKEIVIMAGTGVGQIVQVTAYDTTTLVATVTPAWTTQPVEGDAYMIVQVYTRMRLDHIANMDDYQYPTVQSVPDTLYTIGDENFYGKFLVTPAPDEAYALHLRYYADLVTLDLASTLLSTLYQRWRNLWIQGVKAKQLDSDDDARARDEMAKYYTMLRDTVSQETYERAYAGPILNISG